MNRLRIIDPDPITLGLGIIGATAAVVGMIDVIRRAKLQERKDKEDAKYKKREELRRDLEVEELKKSSSQREELLKLDAVLETIENQIISIHQSLEDSEKVPDTSRWNMPERCFYKYCENAMELSKANTRILERVLAIEPTLNQSAVHTPDYRAIEDDLKENSHEMYRGLDYIYLKSVRDIRPQYKEEYKPMHEHFFKEAKSNPLESPLEYVRLARKRLDFILKQ